MSTYTRGHLDKEARRMAQDYRKEQNPESNYRASRAKVDYWEIRIDNANVVLIVNLDNGAWLTCAI